MRSEVELQFQTVDGESLAASDDGIVHLESEFKPWRVRWIGAGNGAPYARLGNAFVPLAQAGDFFTLPRPRGRIAKKVSDRMQAGDLILYADPAGSHPLRPTLRVHSANLSDEHFAALLEDLGALIAGLSYYLSLGGQRPNPGAWVDSDAASLVGAARYTSETLNAIVKHLRRVRHRPSRSLVRKLRSVKMADAIRHGSAAILSRQDSERDRVRAYVLDFTEKSNERAFVSAVVGTLADHAVALSAFLERQSTSISERDKELRSQHAAMDRMGLRLQQSETSPERFMEAASRLRMQSAELRRFWPTKAGREALRFRSNQLELSQEYGPILRTWREFQSTRYSNQKSATLLEALNPTSIDGTAQLYERWVLVRLYTALVERGFAPPDGERSLLDDLTVEDRELRIAGHRFTLVKQLHEGPLTLHLDFDRHVKVKGEDRQPDLVIHTSLDRSRQTWVFDAKYKDYSLPTPSHQRKWGDHGSHFNDDLYGVAELRYRALFDARLSAIIHPDTRSEYQFWDADHVVPGTRYREARSYPHELVSTCLVPGMFGDANVTKLLRLLFGFHLGLAHICWRCGTPGDEVPQVRTNGTPYRCPTCKSFWLRSWCSSPKCRQEPLVKYGLDSFHKVVDPEQPFIVACPKCGKSPPQRGSVSQDLRSDSANR